MSYNYLIKTDELFTDSSQVARRSLDAVRLMESYFAKVESWAGSSSDAELAADLWARDETLDKVAFPTEADLATAIGEMRVLATTVEAIKDSVTVSQMAALIAFA